MKPLTMLCEFTHRCLTIEVRWSFTRLDVIDTLVGLCHRVENAPVHTSRIVGDR